MIVLLMTGCGTENTGPFIAHNGARPWLFTTEFLGRVQQSPALPDNLLDVHMHIYPGSYQLINPLSGNLVVCYYWPDHHAMHMRVTNEVVRNGCLPHELAHRWGQLSVSWDETYSHGEAFQERWKFLQNL